jgi:hypothetical protein
VNVDALLRVYLDPADIGTDGYPLRWHKPSVIRDGVTLPVDSLFHPHVEGEVLVPAIKDYIRESHDNRCERCRHPFRVRSGMGEWSPCDEQCNHGLPLRVVRPDGGVTSIVHETGLSERRPAGKLAAVSAPHGHTVEAQWRILTVHHLNGIKHDCRWWNLVALCQRCHLSIQRRVLMERVYPLEHTEWFKPYAAGWYASAYLGEELSREETMGRLDELLALERLA